MIAWGAILGDDGVEQVAEYVQIIGEPRINDDIWLYGGDLDTLKTTLRQGRFGIMPAFDARLDDFQIKLLVALLAR